MVYTPTDNFVPDVRRQQAIVHSLRNRDWYFLWRALKDYKVLEEITETELDNETA